MLVRVGNEFIQGTTAAGTQYYQASTDRHQQHSKEHNTQQHQRGTNNKTPTQVIL